MLNSAVLNYWIIAEKPAGIVTAANINVGQMLNSVVSVQISCLINGVVEFAKTGVKPKRINAKRGFWSVDGSPYARI